LCRPVDCRPVGYLVAQMTVDRVTLQAEHVPQFVVVWLASFVFLFHFYIESK